MAAVVRRATEKKRAFRARSIPFSLLVLRYFAYVIVALAAVWTISFLAFSASINSGLVYASNYGPAHADEVAKRLHALPSFDASAVPTAYRYVLFDTSGEAIDSTMPEANLAEAREAAASAPADGTVVQTGAGMGVTYAAFTLADGTRCVLMCEYLPQFTSPELASVLPNPQNLLLIVGCAGSVVAIALVARRASRVLTRALEPLIDVADHVGAQRLDFAVGVSSVRQVSDVLDAMEQMRTSLKTSLEARWEVEERERQQVASLAHDLKTPLTVVRANADFVAEELDGEHVADEGARRDIAAAAHDISAASEQLDAYVHLLIDASRGASEASREPVRPADLCEQIAREARAAAHARGIEADIDIESAIGTLPEAPLDRVALVRAAMNLVSNAAEHARSRIGIACALSGDTLTVRVTDDGLGFSPAALEHGCERLFTDDSARSARGGEQHYGLGLYTAAETARAHGGSLELANLPAGGAATTLSIPLAMAKGGLF